MRSYLLVLIAVLVCILTTYSSVPAQVGLPLDDSPSSDNVELSVIAQAGDSCPAGGSFIAEFLHASENRQGDIAFSGGSYGHFGTFLKSANSDVINSILSFGDIDGDGRKVDLAIPLGINNRKSILIAEIPFSGYNFRRIYLHQNDTLRTIAKLGDKLPAPLEGFSITRIFCASFNNNDQIAFEADAVNPDTQEKTSAELLWQEGIIKVIVQRGEASPFAGAPYDFMQRVVINDRGAVAFRSTLIVGINPLTPHQAITIWQDGQPLKAVIGSGTILGLDANLIDLRDFDNQGFITFTAINVNTFESFGLFIINPAGEIQRVVAPGFTAPIGGIFTKITGYSNINKQRIVFTAQYKDIIGTSSEGIFLWDKGTMTLLLKHGNLFQFTLVDRRFGMTFHRNHIAIRASEVPPKDMKPQGLKVYRGTIKFKDH